MQPIFEPRRHNCKAGVADFVEIVSPYWAPDAQDTVVAKLKDKEKYKEELQELFKKGGPVKS